MENTWIKIQQIIGKSLTPWQKKVWVDSLSAAFSKNELTIYAPSAYMADFVRARFSALIQETVRELLGHSFVVKFSVSLSQNSLNSSENSVVEENSIQHSTPPSGRDEKPSPRALPNLQIGLPIKVHSPQNNECKWRHSFDSFIVGSCNELAHAASRSMCTSSLPTNILFLSSSPGLGKTHLMQSVGKHLYESCNRNFPKVEYLTAEEFASAFYLSLKTQQTDKFKERYRSADLLLLEDVHFLQNKEKMQEELLATLKALDSRGAKAVFTSSFMPTDLAQIDEQLQSRLCAGFVSSIDRPDFETRKRIFKQKAALYQVLLPEDVEETLANHIKSDIRQIESCLQNLVLKARLLNSAITMQMAWDVICSFANHSPILDLNGIIDFICKGFHISREQLFSTRRKQEYVFARNAAFFLARKHTDLSLEAIGRQFNRKHSTVLKGITKLEREMSRQTPLGKQISNTLNMIERNGNIVNAGKSLIQKSGFNSYQ